MLQYFFKFLFALTAAIFLFQSASAYEIQYADNTKSAKLHWQNGVIPISVSKSFIGDNQNIKSDAEILEVIKRSFAVWENAANVKFEFIVSDKLSISPPGKSGDKTSLLSIAQTPENLLLFSKNSEETAALTRVFFNRKGTITEADIILNPYQQFSTDGSIGTYDLQAVLTHEIGHLLGLDHSSVIGAAMQENQGKNGIYNLPNYGARLLSQDDIAGVRGIYGVKEKVKNCCGIVSGSVAFENNSTDDKLQIWLEDSDSGRIAASVFLSSNGKFTLEGLEEGNYRVYAQQKETSNAENLGSVKVSNGKISDFSGKFAGGNADFNVNLIGFNGQLSNLAVPVNAGKSYTIYLSGKNIDNGKLKFGVDSPFIKVAPNSLIKHNYGKEISVVSFEILLDSKVLPGEYSIFAESEDGKRIYLTGGISVEEFENPWSNFFRFNNF